VNPPLNLPSAEAIAATTDMRARLAAGDFDGAETLARQAMARRPDEPLFGVVLANALRTRGRSREALAAIDAVLAARKSYFPALMELARLHAAMGRIDEADAAFARAQAASPPGTEAIVERLALLRQHERLEAALAVATDAIDTGNGDHRILFEAAILQQFLGRHPDSIPHYERLLAEGSTLGFVRNNLAAAYIEQREHARALPLLRDEAARMPHHAETWTNLGQTLLALGDLAGAAEASEQAVALDGDMPTALNNLGLIYREQRRMDEAEALFRRAIAADPADEKSRWNLAMHRLVRGDYAEGLPLHESRWAGSRELRGLRHVFDAPRWDGESLAGKTLLIWGEQGFGDVLQFCRFLRVVGERARAVGGKVNYLAFPQLYRLIRDSLEDVVDVYPLNLKDIVIPPFDHHCPLMSLPLVLGMREETIPLARGYLSASAQHRAYWARRLGKPTGLRVGLCWTGSRTHQRNPLRAIDVERLAPLASVKGVEFFSLQFDASPEVRAARAAGLPLIDHTPEINDFNDSAAFIAQLDLVITVCTSTAHLAGALGKASWVPLDVNPHWIWGHEGETTPWYAAARLFRQTDYKDWTPVIANLTTALAERAQTRSRGVNGPKAKG